MNIKRHALRTLEQYGDEATLTRFAAGAEDEYGTPAYTETTSTVQVRVEHERRPAEMRDAGGEESGFEAAIFLDDTVAVDDGNDGTRPSEFTVAGTTYRVVDIERQGNGLQKCWAREV